MMKPGDVQQQDSSITSTNTSVLNKSGVVPHLPFSTHSMFSLQTVTPTIFSGFPSARQETIYDKLIEKALQLLVSRVLISQKDGFSYSWGKQVCKVHRYLTLMDKGKTTLPKLASVLDPLIDFIKDQLLLGRSESGLGLGLGSCQTSDIGTLRTGETSQNQLLLMEKFGASETKVEPVRDKIKVIKGNIGAIKGPKSLDKSSKASRMSNTATNGVKTSPRGGRQNERPSTESKHVPFPPNSNTGRVMLKTAGVNARECKRTHPTGQCDSACFDYLSRLKNQFQQSVLLNNVYDQTDISMAMKQLPGNMGTSERDQNSSYMDDSSTLANYL